MRANKKEILISWLIGVGFGLFFSGIILSILLYTSNKTTPVAVNKPGQIEEGSSNIAIKESGQGAQIGGLKKEIVEVIEEPEEVKEESEEKPEEEIEEEIQKTEIQTIELTIGSAATAHEITGMLVENKIISDYDGFIAHIVKHNAERSLAHGTMTFPLNSDIETVFKILRP